MMEAIILIHMGCILQGFLREMIGQAADRRGYLYTEIKAELNAAKVVANGIIDHLSKMEEFEGLDSNSI